MVTWLLLFRGRRHDCDRPVEHRELRRPDLERLPGLRLPLVVGEGRLVGKGACRLFGRDDPGRGPEMVGCLATRRMLTIRGLQLLAARQFYEEALDALVVNRP